MLQRGYDRRVAVVLGGAGGKRRERASGRVTPEVEDASVGLLAGRRALEKGAG